MDEYLEDLKVPKSPMIEVYSICSPMLPPNSEPRSMKTDTPPNEASKFDKLVPPPSEPNIFAGHSNGTHSDPLHDLNNNNKV